MRIVISLALILLAPCTALAQTTTELGSGHFEGWPLSSQWGSDKQSFEATITRIRPILGLLTVAENGFGWRRAFTDSESSFTRWEGISAWCAAPETLRILTREPPRLVIYEHINADDLTAIVDEYFRRHAASAEPIGPEIECSSLTVSLPNAGDSTEARRRVIELLEAASSENR